MLTVGHHCTRSDCRHCEHAFIVGVQHCGARGWKRRNKFRLGLSDPFDSTKAGGVCLPYASDNSNSWRGHIAQVRDLAESAHSHFDHHRARTAGGVDEREGNSLFIVETLWACPYRSGTQSSSDEILR